MAERVSRMLEDPRLGPAERARAESLLDGLVDVGLDLPDTIEALGQHGDEIHSLCEELAELPEPCERAERSRARAPAVMRGDGVEDGGPGQGPDAGATRRSVRRRMVARSAARRAGFELLERGDVRRAAVALRQAVGADPDDGEVRSYLGVCLLQLGLPDEAMVHLEHACALDPDEALHHWNIAAAAKEADRMCRGYLALQRYLALPDGFEGHAERRRESRRFLASYEKLIAAMHPGVALGDVLRGEDLFLHALASCRRGATPRRRAASAR